MKYCRCERPEYGHSEYCPMVRIEELEKENADIALSLEAHKEVIKGYERDIKELEAKLARYDELADEVAYTGCENLTTGFLGYVMRKLCEIGNTALRESDDEMPERS